MLFLTKTLPVQKNKTLRYVTVTVVMWFSRDWQVFKEEEIAHRTRSKFTLTDTPISAIEGNLLQ